MPLTHNLANYMQALDQSRTNGETTAHARPLAGRGYDLGGVQLLDVVMQKLGLRSDGGLSRALRTDTATISRIRCEKATVSATLLIRMHELTGMSIANMKNILGREIDS